VNESAHAIACDSQGNAYVTGRASVTGRGDQFITMKLWAGDGEIDWLDTSGGSLDDWAWDIVVGPDDNPVVTGVRVNADATASAWTVKYDRTDGSFLWDRPVPGAVNNQARAGWLAVADNGDVIMANRTWGGLSSYDIMLERYEAGGGTTAWDTVYNSPDNGLDDPRMMIGDGAGNVIVVGVHNGNYMVVKFDAADGDTLWTAGYNGPPGWYDVANCAAIGPGGEVVVSGFSDGSGTGWDVATVGFDSATGSRLWDARFDGSGQSDEASALAVSGEGDIYVAGYSYGGATSMDMLALRYSTEDLSPIAPSLIGPCLARAYPNPFNPIVQLELEVPRSGQARLLIRDLRGRTIVRLFDGHLHEGTHIWTWDGRDSGGAPVASGAYLAVFEAARAQVSRKILLAK
jgi:hypothetical protein